MYILIIDDELHRLEPFLNRLRFERKRSGIDFWAPQATTVEGFRSQLTNEVPWKPDVIILDVMMPQKPGGDDKFKGGIELLNLIKESTFDKIPTKTPIILTSGVYDLDNINRDLGDKIFKAMPVPFDIGEMINVILSTEK